MKNVARSVAIAALLLAGALGFVYSGAFNISAQDRHWGLTRVVFELARDRSIKAHAEGISVPADLGQHDQIIQGLMHYRAHCAVCHGGPGIVPDDMARGMYPAPPDLRQAVLRRTPAQLFWIIKNGVKMSGMPAWSDHGNVELWPIVAFLTQLPTLDSAAYTRLEAEADLVDPGRHAHRHEPSAEQQATPGEGGGSAHGAADRDDADQHQDHAHLHHQH